VSRGIQFLKKINLLLSKGTNRYLPISMHFNFPEMQHTCFLVAVKKPIKRNIGKNTDMYSRTKQAEIKEIVEMCLDSFQKAMVSR
jgi:hypothetical protein